MYCLNCSKLDLQAFREHAKVGYGHCKLTPTGAFNSFSHEACKDFVQVIKETQEKRIDFAKRIHPNSRIDYEKEKG